MNTRTPSIFALGVALTLLLGGCSSTPQPIRPELAETRRSIEDELRARGVLGAQVVVFNAAGVVDEVNHGFQDPVQKKPVDGQTRFLACSTTKLITASAVMVLASQGRLDLDAPISRYLPQLQPMGMTRAPTIRQLLTHHSGLPSDVLEGFLDSPSEFSGIVERVNRLAMATEPGFQYSYSNVGYALLGKVVETITGQVYPLAASELVLQPFHMDQSSFYYPTVDPNLAQGTFHGQVTPLVVKRDLPTGGLVTTGRDMARFGSLWLRQETTLSPISPRLREEAWDWRRNLGPNDAGVRTGLGWKGWTDGQALGLDLIGHDGDDDPHHALMLLAPEWEMGVVILVSSLEGNSLDLKPLALRILRGHRDLRIPKRDTPQPLASLNELPTPVVQPLLGRWLTPMGLVSFRTEGGHPVAFLEGQKLFLKWVAPEWKMEYKLFDLVTLPVGILGRVGIEYDPRYPRYLSFQLDGNPVAGGERLDQPLEYGGWRNRTGSYNLEPSNPSRASIRNVQVTWLEEEKLLRLSYTNYLGGTTSFYLLPSNGDELRTAGVGRGSHELVRWVPSPHGGRGSLWYGGLAFSSVEGVSSLTGP